MSGRSSGCSSAAISASSRCSGGELGGGRDLDELGVAERALGEGGEPAQRLDLVVEQVDADGALLRRRVDVEQPAADGELAAVLDLVDALVARGDEVGGGLVEVEQLADAQREAVRAQLGVGDLLAQRDGGDHDDRGLGARAAVEQRVERGDAQADEVRRRREVRLVGDAAARVEADRRAAAARRAGRRRGRARRGRRRRRRPWGGARRGRRRAAIRYGRSDCETNADAPGSASRSASGWRSRWLRKGRSDMANGRPMRRAALRLRV